MKQENHDKETSRGLYICNLTKNSFKAAMKEELKENIRSYPRKSKDGRKPVLMKLLTLLNYWCNQMEKLIAAVKIILLTWFK